MKNLLGLIAFTFAALTVVGQTVTNKPGGDVPVSSVPVTGCSLGNLIFKITTSRGHYQCGDDGNYHVMGGSSGSPAWGDITGTLSAQTDLQSALNLKAPLASPSFTTPTLGSAVATTINKVTITTPASGATLTIANGATLSAPSSATVSGTNTGDQTSVTGNAGSATILATARAINGVSFDGSAPVTVTAAAGTLSGATLASNVTASSLTSFGSGIALGTPTSGVLTNATGTASGLTAGSVTTNANLTGPITSTGNATAIASQTGTGTKFVVDTSPTIVTPTIASFVNATHTHQNSAGGGTLDAAVLGSGTLGIARGGTGNTSGTATVNANLVGPVTSAGNTTSVATGAITDTMASLAVKPSCGLVAASNVTLSGAQTIDGVAGTAGTTIVLATAQTSGAENGPWIMQSGAWSRPTWYPSGGTAQAFQFITTFIRLGNTYSGTTWRITSSGAVTIDTTSTTWSEAVLQLNTSSVSGPAPTATALAANGTNCSAGNYALGVDASGNAEGCTLASGGGVTNSAGANVIPKSDGTNIVASGITNASGGALATGAGVAFSITTTPAAATASSTVGVGLNITADNAVAGTTNAGAATGGAVTITAGDAKRLTSGNAAGGAINLTTGAGIGTGLTGAINFNGYMRPTAVADANNPQFGQTSPFTSGMSVTGTCGTCIYSGGATLMQVTNGGISTGSGYIRFSSTDALGTSDVGISRAAAGTMAVGTGAAGNRQGFWQSGGDCFVNADATNATATMATTTCLVNGTAITVTSGRKYAGTCEFYVSDSVSADGASIDFNGGTATATNFRAHIKAFDTTLLLSMQTTALATAASTTTMTGAGAFEVAFTFEPSGNGTFLPRFAQNSHTTGTLTLARGSFCRVSEF